MNSVFIQNLEFDADLAGAMEDTKTPVKAKILTETIKAATKLLSDLLQ
jgi:hypothetical protein